MNEWPPKGIDWHYSDDYSCIANGDCRDVLKSLAGESVDCVVTSPPYFGKRDYGHANQTGLEESPEEFVVTLADIFDQVNRILKASGTLWLNIGDSYFSGNVQGNPGGQGGSDYDRHRNCTRAGIMDHPWLKRKDIIQVSAMLSLEMQKRGWYLRSEIIWAKPNGMPDGAQDRPNCQHEKIYLFTKNSSYFYNLDAVSIPIKDVTLNRRKYVMNDFDTAPKKKVTTKSLKKNISTVWECAIGQGNANKHIARMPRKIARTCILAGCPKDGTVMDPFLGSGTTMQQAKLLSCKSIGIEIKERYCEIAVSRLKQGVLF